MSFEWVEETMSKGFNQNEGTFQFKMQVKNLKKYVVLCNISRNMYEMPKHVEYVELNSTVAMLMLQFVKGITFRVSTLQKIHKILALAMTHHYNTMITEKDIFYFSKQVSKHTYRTKKKILKSQEWKHKNTGK
jgi:hypothetical protein